MKKVLLILFLNSLMFAALKMDIKSMDLPVIFKATSESEINNVAVSDDGKKVLLTNDSKIKIFDIDGDLIKVLNFDNLIKAYFSYDGKKLLILTKYAFYIYDSSTYNEITYFKATHYYFKNLFFRKNLAAVIENACCKDIIHIFNTDTNKEISSFVINNGYVYYGDFSLDLNKIAFSSRDEAMILNLNGDLLNTIPARGSFYEVKWVNTKDLAVRSSNNNVYVFNIKTARARVTINDKNINNIGVLDKNHILIFNKNKIKIFDLKKLNFINRIYLARGEDSKDSIIDFYLSKDKKLLAVAYASKSMKLYDTSNAFKFNCDFKDKRETRKSAFLSRDLKNNKPLIMIYASQTEGVVPLKIYFKFLAEDTDGEIVAYYINFLGREFVGRGKLNKTFAYTFENAGKYKIMVAVKDNEGKITKKQIVINVKEKPIETFEDYKREMIGQ